jgi:hypothetical protein
VDKLLSFLSFSQLMLGVGRGAIPTLDAVEGMECDNGCKVFSRVNGMEQGK